MADIAHKVYGAIEKYSDENLDWELGESWDEMYHKSHIHNLIKNRRFQQLKSQNKQTAETCFTYNFRLGASQTKVVSAHSKEQLFDLTDSSPTFGSVKPTHFG